MNMYKNTDQLIREGNRKHPSSHRIKVSNKKVSANIQALFILRSLEPIKQNKIQIFIRFRVLQATATKIWNSNIINNSAEGNKKLVNITRTALIILGINSYLIDSYWLPIKFNHIQNFDCLHRQRTTSTDQNSLTNSRKQMRNARDKFNDVNKLFKKISGEVRTQVILT